MSSALAISYKVHRISRSDVAVPVDFNGEMITAMVSALEVELVPDDHIGGSVIVRYTGTAAEVAKGALSEGSTLILDFAGDAAVKIDTETKAIAASLEAAEAEAAKVDKA